MSKNHPWLFRGLFLVIILCVTPLVVRSDGYRGTFSGSWSVRTVEMGIPTSGSGSLSINIDGIACTFTCSMSGSGKINGDGVKEGVKFHVSGTNTVSSSGCSGKYYPDSGRIKGSFTMSERGKATFTFSVPTENGKSVKKTKSDSSSDSYPATITGQIGVSSGSGKFVDDDGNPFHWKVSGGFSGTPPGQDEENQGDDDKDPAKGDEKDKIDKKEDAPRLPTGPPRKPKIPRSKGKRVTGGMMPDDWEEPDFDDGPGYEDDSDMPEIKTKSDAKTEVKKMFKEKKENPTKKDVDKTKLSTLLDDVDDPEVKKAIIKEFIKHKKNAIDEDMKSLKRELTRIKDKHTLDQDLDKAANKWENASKDKLKEGVAKVGDSLIKRTWDWVRGKSSDKIIDKLDKLEDQADGVNLEKLNDLKGKIDTAKETIKEVVKIKERIDTVNEKVKEGKITKGRGKVLKGGTILGKALKAVTKWIPVFGDDASEITDKTFEVALKTADKKAERSTAIERCEEDPLSDECMGAIDRGVVTGY